MNKQQEESIIKMIKDANIDGEHMQYILEKVGMDYQMYKQLNVEYNKDAVDDKVNGYTNIQTYRLCVWLDNNTNYHNKGLFDYFFDLVRDGEFEESDYEVIDWNEVVERYSNEQRSHYLGSITRS